ncbi:MAG: hypothetical protein OXI73_01910 [Rhodospirillales bacterium]|nr:hypothetical protein [Rhodospirillales bacterium]
MPSTLAALAVLGLTSGFLVGQAGATADILAAVLPVVIVGGGAAALGISFANPTTAENRPARLPAAIRPMAAYGVIIFSLALLTGNYGGTVYKVWTQNTARNNAIHLHLERLDNCALDEYSVNAARHELGIPPLPSAAFCPTTAPN